MVIVSLWCVYVGGYKRVKEGTEFEEVHVDTDTNNLRVTAGS